MNERLNRFFHCTFFPKRRHINSLLKYASQNGNCKISSINEGTGIPMGKSSGQVSPTLDYCKAFQLVEIKNQKLFLTKLGEVVFSQDPFLKEELTQWLLHFNICNARTGADVWFNIFNSGSFLLGQRFKKSELLDFLNSEFNTDMSRSINPVLSMYSNKDSFEMCQALVVKDSNISRKKPPVIREMTYMYATWILGESGNIWIDSKQILEDKIEECLKISKLTYWDEKEKELFYQYLEEDKIFSIDRQMRPWLFTPLIDYEHAVVNLYSKLI